MRGKNLLIAAVVLVVLILIALFVMKEPPPEETKAVFPVIKKDDVTRVWIRKPAKDETGIAADRDKKADEKVEFEEVVLEKEGKGEEARWFLTKPVRYEAYQSYVDTMLSRLEELKIDALAAESKESYGDLEIDPDQRVQVKVFKGSTQLADFFIGGYRGGATMVRFPDDDKVYRVKGSIRYLFAKPPRDWREKRILNIENDKVVRLEFHSENGDFAFSKVEGKWVDESTPPVPDYDEKKVSGFVSTVAHLRATDFEDNLKPADVGMGEGAARVILHFTEETGEAGEEKSADAPGQEEAGAADSTEGMDESGEEAASEESTAQVRILMVGSKKDESSYHVMLEGNDQIFLISKYTAERLTPKTDNFSTPPKKEEEKKAKAPGEDPGFSATPKPVDPESLPPDVMKKLQAEIKKQQMLKQLSEKAGKQ